MKRAGIVLTVLFALLAFVCGFGGVGGALLITRPATDTHASIRFVVNQGDTTADVADNLAKAGLIRNAEVFRLYARYKKLDTGIQQGVYTLSTDWTMDQIIAKLQNAQPDQQIVTIPPGLRVEQYANYLSVLPNFNADNFKKIVKTGQLADGTNLWEKYWFVAKPHAKIVNALEGYLYPDTYYFDTTDDEVKVVERLLNTLGSHICPGPDDDPYVYVSNLTQCKAHAVKVGSVDIFAAMEKAFGTKNDTDAFYKALTLASIVMREEKTAANIPGVTNLYYTRYEALLGKTANTGDVASMGADPTAQYALETETPPADGKYWQPLKAAAKDVATKNPYNTNVTTNKDLPPGPISAPFWDYIAAAASPSISKYFYFLHDTCGNIVFATTYDQQTANQNKYLDPNNKVCVK